MGCNSEIQGYKVYPILHFHRKFSSSITAQQEWRRSSVAELRKRAEEHCSKGVPEEAHLLELG